MVLQEAAFFAVKPVLLLFIRNVSTWRCLKAAGSAMIARQGKGRGSRTYCGSNGDVTGAVQLFGCKIQDVIYPLAVTNRFGKSALSLLFWW